MEEKRTKKKGEERGEGHGKTKERKPIHLAIFGVRGILSRKQ